MGNRLKLLEAPFPIEVVWYESMASSTQRLLLALTIFMVSSQFQPPEGHAKPSSFPLTRSIAIPVTLTLIPRTSLDFTSSTSQNAAFCTSSTTTPLYATGPVTLLFGVGCGLLTAVTMYLVWSLFANHHDSRNSYEEFNDVDDLSPKKMGYEKIPAKEAAIHLIEDKSNPGDGYTDTQNRGTAYLRSVDQRDILLDREYQEVLSANFDSDTQERGTAILENVDQMDIFPADEDIQKSISNGDQLDEVESETDNYMDALN
ncbi:hypothetical protein WN944_010248 [Citrus x changshan-huyou]|uniref:Uncharacterized protein n=1 Tax=Citrus x changshan-huyou TaxID=2935761 RepID=A0AAP0R0G6_9ROSI